MGGCNDQCNGPASSRQTLLMQASAWTLGGRALSGAPSDAAAACRTAHGAAAAASLTPYLLAGGASSRAGGKLAGRSCARALVAAARGAGKLSDKLLVRPAGS